MRRSSWILLLLSFVTVAGARMPANSRVPPVYMLKGPTLIAFYPLTVREEKRAEVKGDDALDDFEFYLSKVDEPLAKRGIRFEVTNAGWFSVREGDKVVRYLPKKRMCGYYMVAPGKQPKVVDGVTTDDDLLSMVDEYFGTKPMQ